MTRNVEDLTPCQRPLLRKAARDAGVVGAAGLIGCMVLWLPVAIAHGRWTFDPAQFYKAYLFAWLFFVGVSLGALQAVMIHHLTGGEWGYFVRRFGQAAASVLPLLFLLFIPIFFGLSHIYPWADPNNHSVVVAHKAPLLSPWFFAVRYVLYFAIWIFFAWRLRALSLRQDHTGSPLLAQSMARLSAVGLLVYFITMSLASVDWIMSLEPEWYSTVFGFIVCMSQGVTGICVAIITLCCLSNQPPFASRIRPKIYNDLATLLLMAVILWAYNSFAQLLVIWMGNLQGEIPWYVARSSGPWRIMALVLVYLGFLAPFLLLLQRGIKNDGRAMRWICVGVVALQALDTYWWIAPAGVEPFPKLHWLSIVTALVSLVGIGGSWLAAYLWLLQTAPLMPAGQTVPVRAPTIHEADLAAGKDKHGTEPGTNPGIA